MGILWEIFLSSVELHNYITDSVAWNIWNIKLAHLQAYHVWNLILYAPWSIWVSLLKEVRYSGVRTFGRNSLSIMASVTKHSRSALLTSNCMRVCTCMGQDLSIQFLTL